MKWYVWIIILATVFSLSGLAMISVRQDPFQSGRLIKLLFFGSSFVSVWGIATLVLLALKSDFSEAFRRAFFLSVVFLGAVILNRLRLLNIFNFSILLGVVAAMEVFLTRTFRRKEESWT